MERQTEQFNSEVSFFKPQLSHYSKTQRTIETVSVTVYFILQLTSFYLVFKKATLAYCLFPAVLGYLGADFISGFLHWAADTWGHPGWPIFGQSLIRTFREHHIDPRAITKHDWIETNGAITLIAVPLLSLGLYFFKNSTFGSSISFFILTFMTFQCFFGFFTSQIHKYSHMSKNEVPRIVRILQGTGIILSARHHSIHHTFPFDKYYCINSGSLNWLLSKTRFFRVAEFCIQKITRLVPREDDLSNQRRQ